MGIQGSVNQFLALTGVGATALNKQAQANLSEYTAQKTSELDAYREKRGKLGEALLAPEREKVASLDPSNPSTEEAKSLLKGAEAKFNRFDRELDAEKERVIATSEEGKNGGVIGAMKARKNLEYAGMEGLRNPASDAMQTENFKAYRWKIRAIAAIEREQQRKAIYDEILRKR